MKVFKTLLTGLFLISLVSVALVGCTTPKPVVEEDVQTEQEAPTGKAAPSEELEEEVIEEVIEEPTEENAEEKTEESSDDLFKEVK